LIDSEAKPIDLFKEILAILNIHKGCLMKELSSSNAVQSEFVELTPEEIRQINGAAEVAASASGGVYPEINNDPP
jgi:hypothetical protein